MDNIIITSQRNVIKTSDLQFGYKSNCSTIMCSTLVIETIQYFTQMQSPVYVIFIDASKAFDRLCHVELFNIQNPFLTAQSTQIKSVISVPIKDFIHHYPRALFNDIPRVGAHFYDIPGSGRTFTTYPSRGAV